MSLEYQYRVTVTIGGEDYGVFDTMTGGEIDSEETKYKPGGMAPQISLGGSVQVSNVTVGRLYDLGRDHVKVPTLRAGIGRADMIVTKQPLDVDGNVFGKPIIYTGKLKQMTLPDHNSEGSDASKIELEMSSAQMTA